MWPLRPRHGHRQCSSVCLSGSDPPASPLRGRWAPGSPRSSSRPDVQLNRIWTIPLTPRKATCPQALAIRTRTSRPVCAQACPSRNPTGMDSHGRPAVWRSSAHCPGDRAGCWFIPLLGGTPGRGRATVPTHSPAAGTRADPRLDCHDELPRVFLPALLVDGGRASTSPGWNRQPPELPRGRSAHHELGAAFRLLRIVLPCTRACKCLSESLLSERPVCTPDCWVTC